MVPAMMLMLAFSTAPAWADFAAGKAAYEAGDFAEARAQWLGSAEDGEAVAQAALGSLYIHGDGVAVDYREGLKWTLLAAEQGDVTGQFNMGSIYADGLGVEQDYGEAARWFHLSAEQYDAMSRYNLAILYSRGLGVARDDSEAVYMLNTAAIIAGTPEIGQHELAKNAEQLALNLMMTMDQPSIDEAHRRSKEFEQHYVRYYLKGYFERKRAGEDAGQEP
jgi:TPR repeat protein